MDSFTDTRVVEANRLHSEEAKSGNNENYSLWTNNLQDVLHLEPKDTVSVFGAFISERGAGQASSIEIKGQELGERHTFKYTKIDPVIITPDRIDYNLPSRASIVYAYKEEESFPIRDDTIRFTINYYMVANARNSLHLPRRWMWGYPDVRNNLVQHDNRTQNGVSETRYLVSNVSSGTATYAQTPAFYNCVKNQDNEILQKPNNDNTRYTLLVRANTFFTQAGLNSIPGDVLPDTDFRDPENGSYQVYSELKTITIPAGFNSAEFIATEFTRQLQEVTANEILTQYAGIPTEPYPVPVSKIIESQTYKAFNTGSFDDMRISKFRTYFNITGTNNDLADKGYIAGHQNSDGYDYLRQYQYVGCKYPELYTTGQTLNKNDSLTNTGIIGSEIYSDYSGGDGPLIFDVPYSQATCLEWKTFFDAQKLYPEIIDNLNDITADGYNGTNNNLTNTRWCHINRWDYEKQSLSNPPAADKTQLGWGGYYFPRSYNPVVTEVQLCSLLLPMFFDDTQSETFYQNPSSDDKGEYTYGCIGNVGGRMAIYPSRHIYNGWDGNRALWTAELFKDQGAIGSRIESGRRIGFDLHFNAPGMYYLLPLSGQGYVPNMMSSNAEIGGSWGIPNEFQNFQNSTNVPKNTLTDMTPWHKLLYLGADNPKLNWDGTNFSFSDLHTGLNRGNYIYAGDPAFPEFDTDNEAGDVIYEINPRNNAVDYTPDRMPYEDDYTILQRVTGGAGTVVKYPRTNNNYEKWRIYDMLTGIFVDDYGVSEELWVQSLWGLLGFSYQQFHSTNNRLVRIQSGNANQLSKLTTNAEVVEGDTKINSNSIAGVPMYNNMITTPGNMFGYLKLPDNSYYIDRWTQIYPQIIHKTASISIIADNLPTRMIRGYYTIRSNILEGTPFIGGKVNNTTMPVIGIVDKVNGDGDFYFGQESSLTFTITKSIRLASLTISIHDPDGSYARTSEQSTILFKINKQRQTTFNIAEQLLQENKNNPILRGL